MKISVSHAQHHACAEAAARVPAVAQAPDWPNLPSALLVQVLAQCLTPYEAVAARRVCKAWLDSINAAIKSIALSLPQLGAVAKFPALRHVMLEGGWGCGATGLGTTAWQDALAALSGNDRLQGLELRQCDELLEALPSSLTAGRSPLPGLQSLVVLRSACTNPPVWVSQLTGLTQLVIEHSGSVHGRPAALKQSLQWTDAAVQLRRLRSLRISGVVFARLPADVSVLQGLTQLHVIGSMLPVPDELGALTGLEDLNLSYTTADKLPAVLPALTALTKLCLRGCFGLLPLPYDPQQAPVPSLLLQPQKALPHLTALKQLQHLDLASLAGMGLLEVPESVSALTALTALDLSWAGLFGSMSRLLPCTALQELRLCNTRGLELPDGFTALQRLQLLDCGGSHAALSDVLLRLPALEEVTCDEQYVSQHLWERLHCKGVTVALMAQKVESMLDEDGEEVPEEMALYDDDAEPWAEEGF